jgi:hypothetical protein
VVDAAWSSNDTDGSCNDVKRAALQNDANPSLKGMRIADEIFTAQQSTLHRWALLSPCRQIWPLAAAVTDAIM